MILYKKIFEVYSKISQFHPRGPYVQWTGTIWTTLNEGHPKNIHVKFHQIPASGLGGDVVKMFSLYNSMQNRWPQGGAKFDPRVIIE